jgi:hypothetical protein
VAQLALMVGLDMMEQLLWNADDMLANLDEDNCGAETWNEMGRAWEQPVYWFVQFHEVPLR